MHTRIRLTVTGLVQGVGFRPYVYRRARESGLTGFVLNTSAGIVIEVEGPGAEGFVDALKAGLPPLARIDGVKSELLPLFGFNTFEIRLSEPDDSGVSLISPDIATCPDCLREMRDPADRRHGYPFINCTNCGPRYSIVQGVPYDRALTTMSKFSMCPACKAEYDDPADRRFHAQPVACPACGPKVYMEGTGGRDVDPLTETITALKAGRIVAIKGLGGFHLACDAANHAAVTALRERKRKSRKPFALMAPDIEAVKRYCHVSDAEADLLTGHVRPIVLLDKRPEADTLLSPDVAPGSDRLGFMLPYTPLHHLLFDNAKGKFDALVMTSGNLSEEPIVTDNTDALDRLSPLADEYLMHDRDIYMRVDDSVAIVVNRVPRLLRRARGYVPEPFDMGREIPSILACGGELKNTFCITKGRYAVMSQHIGDPTNYESLRFFEETFANLCRTYGASPRIIAYDMHPDYMSTRFAHDYRLPDGAKPQLLPVQHHHAHIAACMAENGYAGRVIGVAFDGTGYGTDGTIWGSEFLLADYGGFTRSAHMLYMPLPGGDKAVKEPWRTALSCLVMAYGPDGGEVFKKIKGGVCKERDVEVVHSMIDGNINSPLSCGMGRLFDAVSSLAGIMDVITFEGEAAIALEAAARGIESAAEIYPYDLSDDVPIVIDTMPLIRAVVDDLAEGASKGEVALRFHATVADMVFRVCGLIRDADGVEVVALSGGVFQNALLFGTAVDGLMKRGFRVLTHSKVPASDGCISLGQAAVAANVSYPAGSTKYSAQ